MSDPFRPAYCEECAVLSGRVLRESSTMFIVEVVAHQYTLDWLRAQPGVSEFTELHDSKHGTSVDDDWVTVN
jgi:hypothetical protein